MLVDVGEPSLPGLAGAPWGLTEGSVMTVVATIAGIVALIAMGYLAALLLRGGDR